MAVSFVKLTATVKAHRFYLQPQGRNAATITDVVERADGTVWMVSADLGGMVRSGLDYADTVSSVLYIESAAGSLRKSEKLV